MLVPSSWIYEKKAKDGEGGKSVERKTFSHNRDSKDLSLPLARPPLPRIKGNLFSMDTYSHFLALLSLSPIPASFPRPPAPASSSSHHPFALCFMPEMWPIAFPSKKVDAFFSSSTLSFRKPSFFPLPFLSSLASSSPHAPSLLLPLSLRCHSQFDSFFSSSSPALFVNHPTAKFNYPSVPRTSNKCTCMHSWGGQWRVKAPQLDRRLFSFLSPFIKIIF